MNESLIGTVALRMGERPHGDSAEFEGIHQESLDNVVDTIGKVARENQARPAKERATGDALAELYIRSACRSGLPAKTIVLGIAYALDPTGSIAANPFSSVYFKDLGVA